MDFGFDRRKSPEGGYRPGMTGVGRVSAPNRAIGRAHLLSHPHAHTLHIRPTTAAHAAHTTRMGVVQKNRPKLQLRPPAGALRWVGCNPKAERGGQFDPRG